MKLAMLLLALSSAAAITTAAEEPCDLSTLQFRVPQTLFLPTASTVTPQHSSCTATKMRRFRFTAPLRNVYVIDTSKSECPTPSVVISREPNVCLPTVTTDGLSKCTLSTAYLTTINTEETITILAGADEDACEGKSITLMVRLQHDPSLDDEEEEKEYEYEKDDYSQSPSAAPTASPTSSPSAAPTSSPSVSPTASPQQQDEFTTPTISPTLSPSALTNLRRV